MATNVKVNQSGADQKLTIVDCGIFKVEGNFRYWKDTHYVAKLPLELIDITGSDFYNLFHSNMCGDQIMEIHVAVVKKAHKKNLNHITPNPNPQFNLDPVTVNNKEVKIIVWLYEIAKRKDDKYLHLCGVKTEIVVNPYEGYETDDKNKFLKKGGDPTPKDVGGNIIVGI